jgi:hypothetical protein
MNEFDDFFNETITIEPFIGQDSYGTPSYGASTSYPCRINGSQRQVIDTMGVIRVSKAKINLAGTPVIGPSDRLTLPSGFVPQQPPILVVNPLTDDVGLPHHTEISV